MRKIYLTGFWWIISVTILMAKEEIQPTITPGSFDATTEITISYDVTGTSLAALDAAFIWVWIPDASINAKYNVNPASSDGSLSDQAKFTKVVEGEKTFYEISLVPQQFFSSPICDASQIGMLLKGNDWSDGQTTDFITAINPLESCFVVTLTAPQEDPAFAVSGETLNISAEATENSVFTLSVNGSVVNTQAGIINYSHDYLVSSSSELIPVKLDVTGSNGDTTLTFNILVNEPSPTLARPSGIIPGINYHPDDPTKATLCLLAPGKEIAYAIGEWNNFQISPDARMYRDGDYFWLEISGLEARKEYAFQYLVDGVYIADPFAEKILDPDDQWIPASIYPELKSFPEIALKDQWYENRLSILQTDQPVFTWQNNDYVKPQKQDLVIYELLIRDFFAEVDRNYLNLIDTLPYLKELGVNAIELMPIQEFAGNNSWGYNPTFMFAPDKAYGTEQGLKQFIDAAHGMGISVILDIVFNHQDIPNPYVALWFDYINFKVTAENPMFNVNATHPFSVFFDMNHESELTQFYMDTTLHYWINEYQVDGFRFDLSKGFTQNQTTDVGVWSNYDAERIALIKRMANQVWSYAPDNWLILEHFANSNEEKELAEAGLMLWGNMHWDYKDLGLGTAKNIASAYHEIRDWSQPNLVAYMESHDEERIMYEMQEYGKSGSDYDVKSLDNALDRMAALSAFFYTIPGPKMLWQFGEFGYDLPINLCTDGTTIDNSCRTAPKPLRWNYLEDPQRKDLFDKTRIILNLKKQYSVFREGSFSINSESSLTKHIQLTNQDNIENPSNAEEMSVYLVANFDVEPQTIDAKFPFTGTWFNYFLGGTPEIVAQQNKKISLAPGSFRLYTNYNISVPDVITSVPEKIRQEEDLSIYPNPFENEVLIDFFAKTSTCTISLYDLTGNQIINIVERNTNGTISLDLKDLSKGLYILSITANDQVFKKRILKK